MCKWGARGSQKLKLFVDENLYVLEEKIVKKMAKKWQKMAKISLQIGVG